VPGLKDEAAAYRDKSTDECIAALSANDMPQRRAAATVLRERGEGAAPATAALTELLDDPDVRVLALRALEHIGPAAASAAPAVRPLLDHPDRFIQLGARLTLERIAPD
jgi:HEAT repeat protein